MGCAPELFLNCIINSAESDPKPKCIWLEEWESETIYKEALDPIRSYVRYSNPKIGIWPYHQKRIYSEEDRFMDANEKLSPYECLQTQTTHVGLVEGY